MTFATAAPTLRRSRSVAAPLAIAFASLLTLAVQGYQFGESNHTVYLLDPLRHAHPELLKNDWFTTQTLQYHALFGLLTRGLMSAGVLEPGFLIGYLLLVVMLHIAWWRIVGALGGGVAEFLVSELLFVLAAGGIALGHYQFLQDSSLLPANISAVALLCAIALWLEARPIGAAVALGVAGAFHLNYAPIVILLWVLLQACDVRCRAPSQRLTMRLVIGTIIAVAPAAANIAIALRVVPLRSGGMPLAEFVDLYVRLRHPHHYDPSSWPLWLWLTFVLPIPPAIFWWIRNERAHRSSDAIQYAARIFFYFSLLSVLALIGAGVAYFSEQLIQASLYRFSIIVKMLSCVGCAFLICEIAARRNVKPHATAIAAALSFALMVVCLYTGPYLGLYRVFYSDPDYATACDWIRQNTPVDAVFIVPPHEQEFRLRAQRAIVVNFKCVPQLSGELPEWRDRLLSVLNLPDLRSLPHPYSASVAAIRDRYREVPPEHLAGAAAKYHARYIIADRDFGPDWQSRRVEMRGTQGWFLYDLAQPAKEADVERQPTTRQPAAPPTSRPLQPTR